MKSDVNKNYIMTEDKTNGYIYLDPLEHNQPHKYTVIFLHGLGDTGRGFVDMFTNYGVCPKNVRIVLPTAPVNEVTCNKG